MRLKAGKDIDFFILAKEGGNNHSQMKLDSLMTIMKIGSGGTSVSNRKD